MKAKITVWSDHLGRYLTRAECTRVERTYIAAGKRRGKPRRQLERTVDILRGEGWPLSLASVRSVVAAAGILRGPGAPGIGGARLVARRRIIAAGRERGLSWSRIGEQLGISAESARTWARRQGL